MQIVLVQENRIRFVLVCLFSISCLKPKIDRCFISYRVLRFDVMSQSFEFVPYNDGCGIRRVKLFYIRLIVCLNNNKHNTVYTCRSPLAEFDIDIILCNIYILINDELYNQTAG